MLDKNSKFLYKDKRRILQGGCVMAKSGVAKLVLSLCLLASVATAGGARTALYDADQGKQSLSIDHTSYQKS